MRTKFLLMILTIVSLLGCLATAAVEAQYAVSSASVGIGRAGGQLQSSQFRVEEFINYHRHPLPRPTGGAKIALDVRWDRSSAGTPVLQIGLATPVHSDPAEQIRPLNLVLVIDCSGSMNGDRIENVKRGIRSFVERLRPSDLVSIVTYESSATVALAATCKTEVGAIDKCIRELRAGGSTNLHAGLMLGYQQAAEHFSAGRTNRVILLTDGIANTGLVDPDEIAAASKQYNARNIDLSIIGLGSDLDQNLLRKLADTGRGLFHFIGDDHDIEKTFVQEIVSLLSPAARDVVVSVKMESEVHKIEFFGYRPEKTNNRWKFKLDDLNHDASQVILGQLNCDTLNVESSEATIKLTYVDAVTGKKVKLTTKSKLPQADDGIQRAETQLAESKHSDIQKNLQIAKMASGLHTFALLSEKEKSTAAYSHLREVIQKAEQAGCGLSKDEDIQRMLKICQNYIQNAPDDHTPRR